METNEERVIRSIITKTLENNLASLVHEAYERLKIKGFESTYYEVDTLVHIIINSIKMK